MRLASYLAEAGITAEAFAAQIGVSHRAVVGRYAKGQRIPRPRVMAKIGDATGGAGQPNDFFPAAA